MNEVRVLKDESHKVGRKWYMRFLVLSVQRAASCPEGIKYAAVLIDLETGERVLAIDNCAGHGHHMHIRNGIRPYHYVDERKLRKDFWMYADMVMGEDK